MMSEVLLPVDESEVVAVQNASCELRVARSGLIRLLRPSNSLAAAALVLIGARLAGSGLATPRAWLAALTMWFVTTYGYVSNDCTDLAEDRINKPERPIPAGAISLATARQLSRLLAAGALGLAVILGWREALVAAGVLVLLTLYNRRLKSTAGGGNVLIAVLAGCTLLTGSVAAQGFGVAAWQPLLPAATYVMLFVAARELVKTLEDVAGDHSAGKQTLALRLGPHGVVAIVLVLALVHSVMGLLIFYTMHYSGTFMLISFFGIHLPLFFTVATLWCNPDPPHVRRCLRLLKGSYLAGLLALVLA